MRKPLGWLLALGLVLSALGAGTALAEPLAPVAVVSVASHDELMGDVAFAGRIAERPELATALSGVLSLVTGGKGLEGLDKGRPLAVVIQTDGQKVSGYGLVPVTDFRALLAVAEPLVRKVVDKGDGVFEIQTDQGRNLYIREKPRGWAVVADSADALAGVPDRPADALGKLSDKYDLAVTVFVQNVPQQQREQVVQMLRAGAERDLGQRPGETDAEYAVRKKLAERTIGALAAAVEEMDQVAVGVSLDHKAERFFVDVSATALPGTGCAKALARLADAKSAFAGLLLPDAAVTGNVAVALPPGDMKDLAEAVEVLKPRAMEEIGRRARSEDEARLQKEIVGNLLEATQKTIASGRSDGAMSLVLKPEAMTLVAGWYTADGPTVEKMLKQVAEAARRENPDLVSRVLKLDAGQVRGVNLHTVTLPLPPEMPDREKAARLVGETLEIVVGVGRESVYVSAGRDAVKTLREAIERSADAAAKVAPMKLSVALRPLFSFAAEVGSGRDRENAARMAEALEKMSGKDRLTLVAEPVERGVQLRFAAEADVLRLIGVAASQQQQQ